MDIRGARIYKETLLRQSRKGRLGVQGQMDTVTLRLNLQGIHSCSLWGMEGNHSNSKLQTQRNFSLD